MLLQLVNLHPAVCQGLTLDHCRYYKYKYKYRYRYRYKYKYKCKYKYKYKDLSGDVLQ